MQEGISVRELLVKSLWGIHPDEDATIGSHLLVAAEDFDCFQSFSRAWANESPSGSNCLSGQVIDSS
jgi:hypothetical protein